MWTGVVFQRISMLTLAVISVESDKITTTSEVAIDSHYNFHIIAMIIINDTHTAKHKHEKEDDSQFMISGLANSFQHVPLCQINDINKVFFTIKKCNQTCVFQ